MRFTQMSRSALLSIVLAGSATTSFAQGIEFGPGGVRIDPGIERRDRRPPPRFDGISEREAIRIARRRGVADVERVRETPRGFIVAGTDRDGEDIRVTISRDGDVIDVR